MIFINTINIFSDYNLINYMIILLYIIIGTSTLLTIFYSQGSKWVTKIINGIERLVLVTAAGTVVYDSFGRPVTRGNNGGENGGNQVPSSGGSGNSTGNNAGSNNAGSNNAGNNNVNS